MQPTLSSPSRLSLHRCPRKTITDLMGTSGCLGFVVKGKRHPCYVHHDGSPDCLGASIKRFICDLTPEQIKTMQLNLEKLEWVSTHDPPPLHMAHVLPVILEGGLKRMAEDSLLGGEPADYSYFIDFENEILHWWFGAPIRFRDIEPPKMTGDDAPGAHIEELLLHLEFSAAHGSLEARVLEERLGQGIISVKEYWDIKPGFEELLAASKEQARKIGLFYALDHTQPRLVAGAMFWLEQYPVPEGWVVKDNKVLRAPRK